MRCLWSAPISALFFCGLISSACADDPVAVYTEVSESGDTALSCNDLSREIADVRRDVRLLEDQRGELQSIIDQGPQTFTPQSTKAGNALEAFGTVMGDAAVIDATSSMPDVQNSLATAQSRVDYLEGLQGSCSQNRVSSPAPVQEANSGAKTVHLRSAWAFDHYLNIEHGVIASSTIQPDWLSATWDIEPVEGTSFVRFRNHWKQDEYLNNEGGKLQSTPIDANGAKWWSAMWEIDPLPDSKAVQIRSRWKPDQYLNIEHGDIECGPIQAGWVSARWTLE